MKTSTRTFDTKKLPIDNNSHNDNSQLAIPAGDTKDKMDVGEDANQSLSADDCY